MREILPDLALWRRVQEAHRGEAHPPRRTGEQVAAHLAARYPAERLDDARFSEVVLANLRESPYASLPPEPRVRAFRVRREAAGAALYAQRDRAVYGDTPSLWDLSWKPALSTARGATSCRRSSSSTRG